MEKVKKGVRLEHISKIYQDPKTGKDFYAVLTPRESVENDERPQLYDFMNMKIYMRE